MSATISLAVAYAEAVVESVAAQERTAEEALDILARARLNPDREALSEAVAALELRDRWLSRQGDPVAFTGVDFSADSSVSVWDLAVELSEDCLASHLGMLAMAPHG